MGWRDGDGLVLPMTALQFLVWELWLAWGEPTRLEWHVLRVAQRALQAGSLKPEAWDDLRSQAIMFDPAWASKPEEEKPVLPDDLALMSPEELDQAHEEAMALHAHLPILISGDAEVVRIDPGEAARIEALPLAEAAAERRRLAKERKAT